MNGAKVKRRKTRSRRKGILNGIHGKFLRKAKELEALARKIRRVLKLLKAVS